MQQFQVGDRVQASRLLYRARSYERVVVLVVPPNTGGLVTGARWRDGRVIYNVEWDGDVELWNVRDDDMMPEVTPSGVKTYEDASDSAPQTDYQAIRAYHYGDWLPMGEELGDFLQKANDHLLVEQTGSEVGTITVRWDDEFAEIVARWREALKTLAFTWPEVGPEEKK